MGGVVSISTNLGCFLKKSAYLVALLFFLAAPVVYAYDFGSAGIVAAVGATAATLALVFGAPAALGTIAIGSLVAGITFPVDHAAEQSSSIEAQLSPASKLATPDGWTAPASGLTEPTPPSTASTLTVWHSTSHTGITFASQAEALNAYNGDTASQAECDPARLPACYVRYWSSVYNSWVVTNSQVIEVQTCPAGYTLSGSTCNLTDASQVMKPADGRCTIKRTGNSFGVDPRDPDCLSGKIPATTAVQPNVITAANPDGSSKSIQINADGSSTITESRPNNSNNTTETNTTTLSAPDASGAVKVTGQGSGVAPGTGTQAGSSTAPVNFDKSGLATEGTLTGIKGSIDAIKDGLDPGSADSSLAAEKSLFDSAADALTGLFTSEPSKAAIVDDDFSFSAYLPASCGCTPLTMTILGKTRSYDWCAPMATFKGVLSWVFGMMTAFYVLMLFRVGGGR